MNLVNFISTLVVFSATTLASPRERETDENWGISGGVSTVDANSPEIIELAKKVMNGLNANYSGFSRKQKINRILKAKQQVVAGTLTTLDLEICPDPDVFGDGAVNVNNEGCKICRAKVWEKPWEDFFQVTEFGCKLPSDSYAGNKNTRMQAV